MKKMLMCLAIAVMTIISLPAFALDDGIGWNVASANVAADASVPADVQVDAPVVSVSAGPGDDDEDPDCRDIHLSLLSASPRDHEDDYERLRDRSMNAHSISMNISASVRDSAFYWRT